MIPVYPEPQTVNPAPDVSATPPCPHFGPCGGCQLQDLAYPAQLAQKAEQLRGSLAAANLALPALQVHASPPLAYRNRIRLSLAQVEGGLRAGYLSAPAAGRHPEFVPITQCPIAAPILWAAAGSLVALINETPAPWLRNPRFKLDQVELFTTADDSALQFTLYLRSSTHRLHQIAAAFTALCESLRARLPELAGVGIAILPPAQPGRSRRAEIQRSGPAWGSPGLKYTVQPSVPELEPLTYWVPRGAFFQVNRFLLPQLVGLVAANRVGTLAWDLYAGVGLFTRALAPSFTRITAVEIAEPAFTALASAKLPNRHAVKDTTLDFLHSAVLQRDRPDLIVLDPPRTGAGPEVCSLLGRIAASTLIYVSCSPETLPADLGALAACGYAIAELHLLDLFPQTTHIETVVILTRPDQEA